MCFSHRMGKVQMCHADTAVAACFLLAWRMDQKWFPFFKAGLRSSTFCHTQKLFLYAAVHP